jgi:hypothetical protein
MNSHTYKSVPSSRGIREIFYRFYAPDHRIARECGLKIADYDRHYISSAESKEWDDIMSKIVADNTEFIRVLRNRPLKYLAYVYYDAKVQEVKLKQQYRHDSAALYLSFHQMVQELEAYDKYREPKDSQSNNAVPYWDLVKSLLELRVPFRRWFEQQIWHFFIGRFPDEEAIRDTPIRGARDFMLESKDYGSSDNDES